MASVNKVTIIGNLGADPELRYTGSGVALCNFRVATTETWKDKSGQKQERTEWHRIEYWGKGAEACGRYLSKGASVCVMGSIRSEKYTDQSGAEKTSYKIRADHVEFLGTKGGKVSLNDELNSSAPSIADSDIPF